MEDAGLMFRSLDGSRWSSIPKGSGAVSVEDPLSAIVEAVSNVIHHLRSANADVASVGGGLSWGVAESSASRSVVRAVCSAARPDVTVALCRFASVDTEMLPMRSRNGSNVLGLENKDVCQRGGVFVAVQRRVLTLVSHLRVLREAIAT